MYDFKQVFDVLAYQNALQLQNNHRSLNKNDNLCCFNKKKSMLNIYPWYT